MQTTPFPIDFESQFIQGLQNMLLEQDQLGGFILVLANALYDPKINRVLHQKIHQRFDLMVKKINYGGYANAPIDDIQVFKKIQAIGLKQIAQVQFREMEQWKLQFNPLRALRPPRISDVIIKTISTPFDEKRFHFDQDFLKKEIFWQGTFLHRHLTLLYNKFPFAPLHCLAVPDIAMHQAQILTQPYFDYIWNMTIELAEKIPQVGFGYNSFGAYSSVNHLHFHLFVNNTLNIENSHWKHLGGTQNYPAECIVFHEPKAAWQYIQQQHQNNVAYNLLYRPQQVFILKRKHQGQDLRPAWSSGFAWQEMAGGFSLFSKRSFDSLIPSLIKEALNATHLD